MDRYQGDRLSETMENLLSIIREHDQMEFTKHFGPPWVLIFNLEGLRKQNKHLALSWTALNAKLRETRDQVNRLQDDNNDFRDKNSRLQYDNSDFCDENNRLKNEIHRLENENNDLKFQNNYVLGENYRLTTTNNLLQDRNSFLQVKNHRLKDENKCLWDQLGPTRLESENLKQSLSRAEAVNKDLSRKAQYLQAQIDAPRNNSYQADNASEEIPKSRPPDLFGNSRAKSMSHFRLDFLGPSRRLRTKGSAIFGSNGRPKSRE
jgi:DNA repair exonuclease SbcCD ATPase subunit